MYSSCKFDSTEKLAGRAFNELQSKSKLWKNQKNNSINHCANLQFLLPHTRRLEKAETSGNCVRVHEEATSFSSFGSSFRIFRTYSDAFPSSDKQYKIIVSHSWNKNKQKYMPVKSCK